MEDVIERLNKLLSLGPGGGSFDGGFRLEAVLNLLAGLYGDHRFRGVVKKGEWAFGGKLNELLFRECNVRGLNVYMGDCSRYAERGRLDGFEEACWRRSALQLLDDHFIDWNYPRAKEFEARFRENIEDIDETLRDVSDDAPPVPEDEIPDYDVEEDHWWWRSPVRQDMSEAERLSRLEYDFYDGVYDGNA